MQNCKFIICQWHCFILNYEIWIFPYNLDSIYQDLSYSAILSGRPGAWLVKKTFLYACNHKISKFKIISRTCLIFMIALTVYELRAYIDVCYGGTFPEKRLNQNLLSEFSS